MYKREILLSKRKITEFLDFRLARTRLICTILCFFTRWD